MSAAHNDEIEALLGAARSLLRGATRPAADSATAQVNAAALDRLRAAVDRVTGPVPTADTETTP